MKIDAVIKRIISLPERFNEENNTSIYSLLRESGYFDMYNKIGEADILGEVAVNPKYISDWLTWSDNKRNNSGWYFKQNENGKYTVGYFPYQKGMETREYIDVKNACAAFIKLELEDIRKS